VVVSLAELDLELHTPEKRRGRMEDKRVDAGLEAVRQPRAAVAVGLCHSGRFPGPA